MYGNTPRINKSPVILWVHTCVIRTILYTSNSLLAATGKMLLHNSHKKCKTHRKTLILPDLHKQKNSLGDIFKNLNK